MKHPHHWSCCSFHDESGRRGIWYRLTKDGVELCAGREGDDDHVLITVGDVVTEETVRKLAGALRTGAWVLECAEYNRRYREAKAREDAGQFVDWEEFSTQMERTPHALLRDHVPACVRTKP